MNRRETDRPALSVRSALPVWTGPLEDLGLYVHIPFCVRQCPYCDFLTTPLDPSGTRRSYLDALQRELATSPWAGSRVKTLFLGGGTPSDLHPGELDRVLDAVRAAFDLSGLQEATIECNPGALTRDRTDRLARLGFNRISLGVQSFQDRHLLQLGRTHNADQARESLDLLRESGFSRLNLDLLFALPGQTREEWESDVTEALALDPGHLSLYQLTIEEGTEFFARKKRGELAVPSQRMAVEMFETAMDRLDSAGYAQYEISSFARPGHECRHNQRYWSHRPWLGVGAGAVSFVEGVRWSNPESIDRYTAAAGPPIPAFIEAPGPQQALGEEMAQRIRTAEGADLEEISTRHGLEAESLFGETMAGLIDLGLLERRGNRLRLTREGVLAADSVCREFTERKADAGWPGSPQARDKAGPGLPL